MPQEFEKTFEFLARSGNAAATPVLIAALRSEALDIREFAFDALLKRSSAKGEAYLFEHWHELSEAWRLKIKQQMGVMTAILREQLLSPSRPDCEKAAAIALELEDFDLVRSVTTAAEDANNPNRDVAGRCLVSLIDRLRKLLDEATDARKRNLVLWRGRAMESLDDSMRRCSTHQSDEIVESFLMLTSREHPMFRHLLDEPNSQVYKLTLSILKRTLRPAIVRLILSVFSETAPCPTLLAAAAWRTDPPFVAQLLDTFSSGMSEVELRNIKKIARVGWSHDQWDLLRSLTGRQQETALRFLIASSQDRDTVFGVIHFFLTQGKPDGRLAAIDSLAKDRGAVASQLVIDATSDEDPEVAAAALRQLRHRGIPGSLKYLLAQLDSEHEVVRVAVRESLEEFSFSKYLAAFDLMMDDRRETTGHLVRKIDTHSDELLVAELNSEMQSRRRRAIEVVECLGIAEQMQGPLLNLLKCDDYLIRVAAANALTNCNSDEAIAGLREALLDRNVSVQQAAEASLQSIAERRMSVPAVRVIREKTPAGETE
ncbi:HEAT repeat domain-containing protein [Blastopirellula sp. JC732]|uniref:HEAT repeat domain-containing protein n=1 Tax=Blastopirellula sediminis TaxID=2894196 RepID=A0A9X1MQB5_9BACT|nr:HEAT repeat domain-containing protein [Blastopirellula sediminis]MCC9605197.1 HEAT repeat domain-containing protein [Blastopirellula sediminis]MCC9631503.1 HEAT repeat domain-containing protein [Blastopirellula sediminis]